jgi:hypothetical protein
MENKKTAALRPHWIGYKNNDIHVNGHQLGTCLRVLKSPGKFDSTHKYYLSNTRSVVVKLDWDLGLSLLHIIVDLPFITWYQSSQVLS